MRLARSGILLAQMLDTIDDILDVLAVCFFQDK